MSGRKALLDACIVSGLDDIDLVALEMRLDLLLRSARGTVHAGTEGVSNGYNLRSQAGGFRAMVFVHDDSLSLYAHHSGHTSANAAFNMPADDALKAQLEFGEAGIELFVRTWREAMACNPSRHTAASPDHMIETSIGRIGELVSAVISAANPDYPTWQTIHVETPTWAGSGSITANGKPLMTSAMERMILDAFPRIGQIEPLSRDKGYTIHPYQVGCKFSPLDSVAILRTLSEHGLELPDKILRKAGMERTR